MNKKIWNAALMAAGLGLSLLSLAKTPEAPAVPAHEAAGEACVAMARDTPARGAISDGNLVLALESGPVASRVDSGRPAGSDNHAPRQMPPSEDRASSEGTMAQALLAAAARPQEPDSQAVDCNEFAGAFVRDLCDWYEANRSGAPSAPLAKGSTQVTMVSAIHRVLIDSVGAIATRSAAVGEVRPSAARGRN